MLGGRGTRNVMLVTRKGGGGGCLINTIGYTGGRSFGMIC